MGLAYHSFILALGLYRGERDCWNRGAAGAATGGIMGATMMGPAAGVGYGILMGSVALWSRAYSTQCDIHRCIS
jgi:hypothetical protein